MVWLHEKNIAQLRVFAYSKDLRSHLWLDSFLRTCPVFCVPCFALGCNYPQTWPWQLSLFLTGLWIASKEKTQISSYAHFAGLLLSSLERCSQICSDTTRLHFNTKCEWDKYGDDRGFVYKSIKKKKSLVSFFSFKKKKKKLISFYPTMVYNSSLFGESLW